MRSILYFIIFFLILSNPAYALIACNNIDIQIQSASVSVSGFHAFSEQGVTGSTIFLEVAAGQCTDSDNGTFAPRVFLVIDDIQNSIGLKRLWISMLLSAKVRGKTITVHAHDLGINSKNFQVIEPYYLNVN